MLLTNCHPLTFVSLIKLVKNYLSLRAYILRIVIKCTHTTFQVEPMACPTQLTLDGEGGPRYVDHPLPYLVELVIALIFNIFFLNDRNKHGVSFYQRMLPDIKNRILLMAISMRNNPCLSISFCRMRSTLAHLGHSQETTDRHLLPFFSAMPPFPPLLLLHLFCSSSPAL